MGCFRNLPQRELDNNFMGFLSYYNSHIKDIYIPLDLADFKDLNIILSPLSTTSIRKTKYKTLKEGKIVFYSNPKSTEVKELMRHFKNMVSHSENIKKGKIDGIEYYRFYDSYKKGKTIYDTMKGLLPTSEWQAFLTSFKTRVNSKLNIKEDD